MGKTLDVLAIAAGIVALYYVMLTLGYLLDLFVVFGFGHRT